MGHGQVINPETDRRVKIIDHEQVARVWEHLRDQGWTLKRIGEAHGVGPQAVCLLMQWWHQREAGEPDYVVWRKNYFKGYSGRCEKSSCM